MRNKILVPKTCGDCDHRSSDSCRDFYWFICGHPNFEKGEEPIIELNEPPVLKCPLRIEFIKNIKEKKMCNINKIEIGLLDDTVSKIDDLVNLRKEKNKSNIIGYAISLLHLLSKASVDEKAEFIVKYPNGKRERLILP